MIKIDFRCIDTVLILCMIAGASVFYPSEVKASDLTVGAGCTYATINAAITAASPGDRLLIEGGVTFTEKLIINKNLTLQGGHAGCTSASSDPTTINGGGSGSVVVVNHDLIVTLTNLNLTNGNSTGGGLYAADSTQITLDNVLITGNTGDYGAGLYVGPAALVTLSNSTKIQNNTATTAGGGARVLGILTSLDTLSDINSNSAPHGGGVSVVGGEFNLIEADMSGNQATAAYGKGGAILLEHGAVATMTGNVWIYNENLAYDGAGIYAYDSDVVLGTAAILGNTASNGGGGVYLTNDSSLSASNARVGDDISTYGNEAAIGAGIYASGSTVDFGGTIFNNIATTQGGGIYAEASTINLTDATVGGTGANQANQLGPTGLNGAGLYLDNATQATLNNTVVSGNTFQRTDTGYGGGAYVRESVLTLINSTIENHIAPSVLDGRGAGVYLNNATLTVDNSQIISNEAGSKGGGIRLFGTSTLNVLNNSHIDYNDALGGEGGAIAAGGSPTINISNATLKGNTASTNGGAIYLDAGTLNFTGGWTLSANNAAVNGGAIAVMGTAVTSFTAGGYSLVNFNQAQGGHGGMVYLGNNTTMKLYATSGSEMYIYANQAAGNGGALYADSGGYFDIYGQVNFDRNRADNGGAIYLSNGSRVWTDDYVNTCPQLWDNWADYGSGGAICAVDSPSVQCDGAIFGKSEDGNQAAIYGGAIYLQNSTFDADNCIFADNQAVEHGGAIAAYNTSLNIHAAYTSPSLSLLAKPAAETERIEGFTTMATGRDPLVQPCSVFSGNIADRDINTATTGNGGAIYLNTSALIMKYTHLYNNSAERGGAIYQEGTTPTAEVSNSLIYGNTSTVGVGAGIRTASGTFTLTHDTLANNINGAGYSQANTVGDATNCIAWGNASGGFWKSSGTLTGTCNIDQSGTVGLNIDPRFVDAANNDFRLLDDSPAIDTCATGLTPDLINRPRPNGIGYDMGAYEYYLEHTVEAIMNPGGGGTVSGTGTYISGSTVIVNASAAPGYVFVNWTVGDMVVSYSPSYSFTVTDDISLQANFRPKALPGVMMLLLD